MTDIRIPLCEPCLEGNAERYLMECLTTNYVSSVGPFIPRFEEAFAARLGAENAVACASGTAALHTALRVVGVERGDEVLVSDFTFIASVNPVTYQGARPVLVDADPATWNMDGNLVAEELRARAQSGRRQPRAVVVAHILGLLADPEPLVSACAEHGVALVEDAAEALGARYADGVQSGRYAGTVGRVGCYSFNGNKIITTGGGGMIATPDKALADRARHLTTQAKLPGTEYLHDEIGYNYRLTNLAAALGLAQIEQLSRFIERKLAIAARYDEALAGLPGVTSAPRPAWSLPTMWMYAVRIDPAVAGISRVKLLERLAARGIQTRPVWAPAHLMSFYRDAPRLGGAVGEAIHAEGLSLPCSVALAPAAQEEVIAALKELFT